MRRPPTAPLFPTRRSSDLRRRGELCRRQSTPTREGHPRPLHSRAQAAYGRLVGFLYRIARRILYAGGVLRSGNVDARSEEHTSELQSHSDLVCRLLLEKKK